MEIVLWGEMIGIYNVYTLADLLILIVGSNHSKFTKDMQWQLLT